MSLGLLWTKYTVLALTRRPTLASHARALRRRAGPALSVPVRDSEPDATLHSATALTPMLARVAFLDQIHSNSLTPDYQGTAL